jgi:glycine hydroxymethyltransferase
MAIELTTERIRGLLAEHEEWRGRCMNLIASENATSAAVRAILSTDLAQRYGDYVGRDMDDRWYKGTRYVSELEKAVTKLVGEVYGASEVELRAISGHLAGLSVILAVCRPGDTVMELCGECCGHGLADRAVLSPMIRLEVLPIPFDAYGYNIDLEATCDLIRRRRPRLVILGSSCFLFPHPVREIASVMSELPDSVLLYDGSHVLGLIACGAFQKPLQEGAHVLSGSTHKTLPGPQGGLIAANDRALRDAISNVASPGLVCNHHLTRIPALGMALLELRADTSYASRVVQNAQALARQLAERGIRMVAASKGFTQSHAILLQTREFGDGRTVASLLEAADIIASRCPLPASLGGEGIRFGTSEVTRHGATPEDMIRAADIVADVLQGRLAPSNARASANRWASELAERSRLT